MVKNYFFNFFASCVRAMPLLNRILVKIYFFQFFASCVVAMPLQNRILVIAELKCHFKSVSIWDHNFDFQKTKRQFWWKNIFLIFFASCVIAMPLQNRILVKIYFFTFFCKLRNCNAIAKTHRGGENLFFSNFLQVAELQCHCKTASWLNFRKKWAAQKMPYKLLKIKIMSSLAGKHSGENQQGQWQKWWESDMIRPKWTETHASPDCP